MSEEQAGEKTEAPTEKRKRDAEKEGDRPDSKEAAVALVTIAGALWFIFAGGALVNALADAIRTALAFDRDSLHAFEPGRAAFRMLTAVIVPLAGLFAVCIAGAVVAGLMLGGGGFSPNKLAPKFERMNPLAGFKRMFGPQGLTELAKALLKVAVTGTVAFLALRSLRDDALSLAQADPAQAIAYLGDRAVHLFLLLGGGLILIALVDVPIAFIRFLERLKMTKQQVREEMKEQEGSPELKGQIRRRQREAARRSTSAAVAGSDVVIANPTHFAVALRYRREADRAPVVVARGKGEMAAMIKAAAREHGVPSLDYPELARALYFTSRREGEIAPDLYAAVAAVLAFVFSLGRQGVRPRAPDVDVPPGLRFDEHGRRIP